MSEQQSQHDDSVEALRSLADGSEAAAPPNQQADDDALASLADGLETIQPDEAPSQQDDPPLAPAAAKLTALPAGKSSAAARRARAETLSGKAHAEQFKRVMVPLLLAVGLLLFALGTAAALLASADGSRLAKWSVAAAFPLGAVLLFGAWFFHRELKQTRKK